MNVNLALVRTKVPVLTVSTYITVLVWLDILVSIVKQVKYDIIDKSSIIET